MANSEYPPPEDNYDSSYEYEEPSVSEPPPPPPVEEPPPVAEPSAVEAPPPVEEPPPAPPVEQAPPDPPPPPPDVADELPPELPADHDTPEAATDTAAPGSDAADVMRPGQPGADELPAEEAPFPVSERDIPLDSVVGPGQPFELRFEDSDDNAYTAVCCAHTIVSEISGDPVEKEEIVSRAAEGGWLTFDDAGSVRGTPVDALSELLGSYGVESSLTTGEGDAWERLDGALAADRRVILPLDQPGFGQYGEDVSVALTGVDRARGVVLASDSAEGAPFQIPLDTFENSWRASDFAMTSVADAPYDVLGMTMHADIGLASTAQPLDGMVVGGQAALGEWWATAAEPVGCCIAPAEPAETALEFTDQSGSVYQLPGTDTTGTGQADLAALDANQDGVPDTWMFDTTGTGQADLVYYDSSGTGEPDSVSYSADDGQWADPLPLTTALNYALPEMQPGTPVAIPLNQMPVSIGEAAANFTVSGDQLASTGANLVITYDQPAEGANLVITDPQPQGGEFVVVPSPYAPTADQLNSAPGEWNLPPIDTSRPAPRLDPNFTDVHSLRLGLQRAYAHQSIIGNSRFLPEGIERRFNPLTGSTIDVPRGSTFP